MLTSIHIKGFRKYKDFKIDGFSRINFILGNNNVGKTSVLEAVFGWACGQNIVPFLGMPLARGRYSGIQQPYWMMEEIMSVVNHHDRIPFSMSFSGIYDGKEATFNHRIFPSDLLTDYDTSYKKMMDNIIPRTNEAVQKGSASYVSANMNLFPYVQSTVVSRWEVEGIDKRVVSELITAPLSIVTQEKPFHPAKYVDILSHTAINENVQIYSSLKRERLLDNVAKEIGHIFPEIIGFDMIPYPDGSQAPISVINRDGTLRPLYTYGDGVQRWFYILGAMALYKNAIICIDEIDTGFHPDAQVEFSKHFIQYASENNVQLFITTHNIEFVDHFLDAIGSLRGDYIHDARIITLRDFGEETRVRTLTAEEAIKARDEYRMELR